MSILKRRILTTFFMLLFLVLAPLIIFYANGNILSDGWNILATGGIYIKSMESGADLFINGKLKNTVGFFTRDYLLKNLKPGVYAILVSKDGYNNWINKIKVTANRVSESNVFMLPVKIDIIEIEKYPAIEKEIGTATAKVKKINPDYDAVKALFNNNLTLGREISVFSTTTGTSTKYALGTEQNPVRNRHMSIWKQDNEIFINWSGSVDSSPRIFCEENDNKINCLKWLKVYSFSAKVEALDFFPGESEIIITAVADTIYAIEAENNSDKKPQIIYSGRKPSFRVLNNIIYIEDGDFFGYAEI